LPSSKKEYMNVHPRKESIMMHFVKRYAQLGDLYSLERKQTMSSTMMIKVSTLGCMLKVGLQMLIGIMCLIFLNFVIELMLMLEELKNERFIRIFLILSYSEKNPKIYMFNI